MFIAIVQHTPVWVWGLLAVLVALGLSQTRDRQVSLARVTVLPLVMIALSVSGVLSAFGQSPGALGGQFIAVRGAAWSQQTGKLHVPGSWVPLALIVALFALKYFVGVSLALHHALAADTGFAASISVAYGGFSGVFLARGLWLRQLAKRPASAIAA